MENVQEVEVVATEVAQEQAPQTQEQQQPKRNFREGRPKEKAADAIIATEIIEKTTVLSRS